MASIRTRLTLGYLVTMAIAILAFAVAVSAARRARGFQDLGQQAIHQGDQLVALVREARVSRRDSLTEVRADTVGGDTILVVRPTSYLRDLLDPLGGYFLVFDRAGRTLYRSRALGALSESAQAALGSVAVDLDPGERAAVVDLPHDPVTHGRLLLVARRDTGMGPHIGKVVVGLDTQSSQLQLGELAGTAVMLAPLLLVLAGLSAVLVGRGTFRPLDEVIRELGAISDGRSLHRRLPADQSEGDLQRLTGTLNAMIGRLETSFAGLRRFTADASHELKTPLTVMRANVERAMSPRTSSTERMIALEEALQEVARMTDLVDSLLTLARADEGRFDLHREPVRLDAIVRDVYETAQILGEDAGLTVSLPSIDEAVVMGDPVRLRQLFLNLVTNAIKYTPRGGRVDVALRRRSDTEVAFAVRDTGMGIAAADLPHIFDRFWRADRARSRASERGGFGLGLAISQWIAQAHGGSLEASSRLGRGSVFIVSLPIARAEPSHDVQPAADEPEEGSMKRS